jgi:hypothetical protein
MRALRSPTAIAVLALPVLAFQACGPERWGDNIIERGRAHSLGGGWVQTYAELGPDGSLAALGVALKEEVLERLPTPMLMIGEILQDSARRGCSDLNGDGEFDAPRECIMDRAEDLALPRELDPDVHRPVEWVSLTWYPQGHDRPSVYNLAHFDVRFHLGSPESFAEIGFGACGVVIDCDAFERATIPVPEPYLPEDYEDVGAALPGLGNHLVDSTLPGLYDFTPFAQSDSAQSLTQAFVYGVFEGHLTFWQVLAGHDYLEGKPAECQPIKQPQAWEVSGFYPTERCVRWVEEKGEFRVSVEGFVYREAT